MRIIDGYSELELTRALTARLEELTDQTR
jgi:hypothetical protein